MRLPVNENDLPDEWYNIIPDLDFTIPPLMGSSGYHMGTSELEPLATYAIIDQELERKKNAISIPKGVREQYSNWRPTPIFRADRLEKELDTPARIFYKYDGGGMSISHESNTANGDAGGRSNI